VIALRHERAPDEQAPAYPEEVITQPAFLAGKVLDALLMDRLEYELQRIDLVNALIERGSEVCGEGFMAAINQVVRERRGEGYRLVRSETIRPSRDLGVVADECQKRNGGRALGWLGSLLTRAARHGVREEADLLSYLYFDRCFTAELAALGRADARQQQDRILALLAD
jgi:NTE family protein